MHTKKDKPEITPKLIYKWFKELPKITGKSNNAIAEDIGRSRNIISRFIKDYERGKERLVLDAVLYAIADKYNIEPPFKISSEVNSYEYQSGQLKLKLKFIKTFLHNCTKITGKTRKQIEEELKLTKTILSRISRGMVSPETAERTLQQVSKYLRIPLPKELQDIKNVKQQVRLEGCVDFERGDSIKLYPPKTNNVALYPLEGMGEQDNIGAILIQGAKLSLCVSNNSIIYYTKPFGKNKVSINIAGNDCVIKKNDGSITIKTVEKGDKKDQYFLYSVFNKNRPIEIITLKDVEYIARIEYIRQREE